MPAFTGNRIYSNEELGSWAGGVMDRMTTGWSAYKTYEAKSTEAGAQKPGFVSQYKVPLLLVAAAGGAYYYFFIRKRGK